MTRTVKNIAVLSAAALMCAGALALTGCGESESTSTTVQSATPAAESTTTTTATSTDESSSDEEQDNCYGDDLPVVNS
jgi:ABC-type glycerol-3-phosphate transport system substrate-binding protein